MRTPMQASWQQRTARIALSTPAQAGLYLVLWTLIVWLIYFSTYPAVHNTAHSLRHHTAGVSCH